MIKASHNIIARNIFNVYIDRLLRKNFSDIFLVNSPPEAVSNAPLIITPNHISWWDGFFIDLVNRRLIKRKLHLMMLEEQLKRYWFFRYLGAYSIRQDNPISIIETASYSRAVTNDRGNLNVIYPQGEIEPYDKRPVAIKSGLKYFIRDIHSDCLILPVLFKIQFEEKMKPFVYCCFAETISAGEAYRNYSLFIKKFEAGLASLDKAAACRETVSSLFEGR